jgi:hypothetical protein
MPQPQKIHVRNASIQTSIEIRQEQQPQIIPQFISNQNAAEDDSAIDLD